MDIEQEINEIQKFVDKENFHAAINLAISAMNECRRIADQAKVNRMLDYIEYIVATMRRKYG